MRFEDTPIPGLLVVRPERLGDERGHFARTFCSQAFAERGLVHHFVQSNSTFNAQRGTLRGMHFQAQPHAEAKLVRCTAGQIWDVALDLRPDSPTFLQHWGLLLSASSGEALYLPEGMAHGFLSLSETSEVLYLMGHAYVAEAQRGLRFDDPAFGIRWPETPRVVSAKDRSHPDWRGTESLG